MEEKKMDRLAPQPTHADDISFMSICVAVCGSLGTIYLACLGSDFIQDIQDDFSMPSIGTFLLLYTAFLHSSRSLILGVHYMLEILWGCNTSLLMAAMGLLTGRPLLVGTASLIVGLDQSCWYIDCLGYLVTGRFPLGVAKYLTCPSTSWLHFFTAFHHLWFLPVCLFSLSGRGMPEYSYTFSVVLTSILVIISRTITPYAVKQGSAVKIFNINMAYEFWQDVQVGFAHRYNHHHPMVYLPYLIIVCNLALNTLPVILLYKIANFM